jgi:hypothetical protein
VLGVALSLGAISVLATASTPRRLIFAGALAGLAVLTKQTFLAALLAGTLWLWRRQPGHRPAVWYAGSALLVVAIPCLLLQLTSPAFVANTVLANLNPIVPAELWFLLPALEVSLGPALILAAMHAASERNGSCGTLLVLYWLASALPLVGLLKLGAFYNYWIELGASTAVLATLAIWHSLGAYSDRLTRLLGYVPLWLLLLDLVWIASRLLLDVPATLSELQTATDATQQSEFQALVDRVRAEPGPVLADPLDVVVLADRPVLLEPLIFGIFERQGSWDPAPLVTTICSGGVSLLVLDSPIERVAEYAPLGAPWWPEAVVLALRQRMQLDSLTAGRYVYVPSSTPPIHCAG